MKLPVPVKSCKFSYQLENEIVLDCGFNDHPLKGVVKVCDFGKRFLMDCPSGIARPKLIQILSEAEDFSKLPKGKIKIALAGFNQGIGYRQAKVQLESDGLRMANLKTVYEFLFISRIREHRNLLRDKHIIVMGTCFPIPEVREMILENRFIPMVFPEFDFIPRTEICPEHGYAKYTMFDRFPVIFNA